MAPAVFIAGLGRGACFGAIFDITLGVISAEAAGSAGGSLTAVQQMANGIGSAVITTVCLHSGAPDHAMAVSLVAVVAVTAACLPALRLLPRGAPAKVAGHGARPLAPNPRVRRLRRH
ncbi:MULTISPECIES: hypothetical protein [unclassified Streptomyces]|uniref:hypothetical protein n=1 Tax=unclassified Streptomyces TaxID=2593676 RepID=UPI0019550C89|nr:MULTISPECIES: hypothetical protein [unclassified Streptomyces]